MPALVAIALALRATPAAADPPRSLAELTSTKEPAWLDVQAWVKEAKVTAEILPIDRPSGERTLLALQVTTRSPMGAIALESGGILVEHGWLRILGGGGPRMSATLITWNVEPGKPPPYLIVADDAIGGFYAVNGGGLPGKPGEVLYFSPQALDWENLGMGYSAFLRTALAGGFSKSYESLRWKGWEKDAAALHPDTGFSFYPPLFTREARDGKSSRRAVPLKELWSLQMDVRRQLDEKGLRDGDAIKMRVVP